MEDLLKSVAILIGLILYSVIKKWWDDKQKWIKAEKNFSVSTVDRINKEVTHEEKKILWRYSAMRMYVIHFTNGTITEAGVSVKKIIFMHEVVQDYYVEPIAKHYQLEQALPQKFIYPYSQVSTYNRFFISDVELEKKNTEEKLTELNKGMEKNTNTIVELEQKIEYYNWLLGYKVKSVLWLSLENKSGKLMAIQVIHWPAARAIDIIEIPKIIDMKKSVEDVYNKNSVK